MAPEAKYNGAPYDYALANAAASVDHCMKLGAVVLDQRKTGFHVRPDHAPQPSERRSGHQRSA